MRRRLASVAVLLCVGIGLIGCAEDVVTRSSAPAVAPGAPKKLQVLESCWAKDNEIQPTVHIMLGYEMKGEAPAQRGDDKFLVPVPCKFDNTWLSPTQVRVTLKPTAPTTQPEAFEPRTYRYDTATHLAYRVTSQGEVKLKRPSR